MTVQLSTPQSNIELMRTAFAALGRKDADAIVKLMPPDFIINLAGVPYQKRGTAVWRKHAEILFSAFPDIQLKVEDIFAKGRRHFRRGGQSRCSIAHFRYACRRVLWRSAYGKESRIREYRDLSYRRGENCRGVDLLRHADLDGPNRRSWLFDGQARIHVVSRVSGVVRTFLRHCHRRVVNGAASFRLVLIGLIERAFCRRSIRLTAARSYASSC